MTLSQAQSKMMSRSQSAWFRLHRTTICRFWHRRHHLPVPNQMRSAYYGWTWYCNKCCDIIPVYL